MANQNISKRNARLWTLCTKCTLLRREEEEESHLHLRVVTKSPDEQDLVYCCHFGRQANRKVHTVELLNY